MNSTAQQIFEDRKPPEWINALNERLCILTLCLFRVKITQFSDFVPLTGHQRIRVPN